MLFPRRVFFPDEMCQLCSIQGSVSISPTGRYLQTIDQLTMFQVMEVFDAPVDLLCTSLGLPFMFSGRTLARRGC